ncbi:MAG: DNA/RNA nuclease SfsA [Rhizobiaceae bacterium]
MQFPSPLIEARLIQRYKRFLADVEFEDGSTTTVHCPNPGAMLGLKQPGSKIWISDSKNPKRKLQYTFELIEADDTLVCVNTNLPNKIGREAIEDGLIPSLANYDSIRAEVKYGVNSRIDLLLSDAKKPLTYVEIKNSHLLRTKGLFEFPDCVTARGAKHLVELSNQVKAGHRAVMLFVIQRMDGRKFKLARDMDPNYAIEFDKAISAGVEAYAIRCEVSKTGIHARNLVPIDEPGLT